MLKEGSACRQKGFVGIILILIVLAIFAGSFYYFYKTTLKVTKTPSLQTQEADQLEVENWKTYENKEAGFSINYPAGWVVKEFLKEDRDIKQVEISTEKNLVVVGWGKSGFGGACPEQDFRKIKVDSTVLDSCYQNSDGLETWGSMYLEHNGLTYAFMAYAENKDRNKILKMLESFKFL